ncbi:MAG TPA: histidine kinase [Streptosporangiaceae bacterium]
MTSWAVPRALRAGLSHAPWARRTWRDTTFAVSGAAAAVPVIAAAGLCLAWTLRAHRLLWPACGLLVLLALLPAASAGLTAVQRSRFRFLLGVDLPAPPPFWPLLSPGGLHTALRSARTWRQVAYHLVISPLAALAGMGVVGGWVAGVLLVGFPLDKSLSSGSHAYLDKASRIGLILAGLAVLAAIPWAAAAVAWADTKAALALLGPSRTEQLTRRVENLAVSRAGVVDAADAERRRIERDLHDGAQRRLVSLAMNLGLARAELADLPEPARTVIVDAHEEAKLALAELRDLVRGLHPAILEDRGLDAALSGIAARSPVPVRLRTEMRERATPTVEAVAYFVVSEALANIAKHARATTAEISAECAGGLLRVVVRDDGAGGADPARGTGLDGLARRAASVDGTFSLFSPVGGPTTVTVELPCGS